MGTAAATIQRPHTGLTSQSEEENQIKNLIIIVLFAICLGTALICAQTSRSQEAKPSTSEEETTIRQVIQHYLDVTDKKDGEAIKRAFHPDTKLLSVGKNGLNQMSLEEWWGRVSRIPGQAQRKSQVAVLEVSGLAAVVKIDFGRSKDFVSLLKVNGEWRIVSKILSTSLNYRSATPR